MLAKAQELPDAIDRIYDAVLDPSAWSYVLTDIVDRAGGAQAVLLCADVVSGEGDVCHSRYNDAGPSEPYQAYYASINPLHNVVDPDEYAAGWRPLMLRDEDWMPREALEATEYYNDFLKPIDACHGLYLRLALDNRVLTAISVGRGRMKGRFEDDAIAALAPLHSDLIRAAKLSRGFAEVRRFAAGARAAMDATSEPLVLLDKDGRIVHANDAGEGLMASGTLLRAQSGRLAATGSSSSGFARALARAVGARRSGDTVALAGSDGHPAAHASVLPIALEAGLEIANGPAVLVRVTPPTSEQRLNAAMDAYHLTRAERALALALLEGMTLAQIASARGITVNTARRHIASLFDKTGTHRQADLVKLLTRVP